MTVLLVILYVLVCIFLVLVVLLQPGTGADLAGSFGGGGSQTSFGPRSAANIMHRMTTVSFVLFVVLSLALAILSGKQRSSVMDSVEIPASPVAETTQEGAEPGLVPAVDETVDPAVGEGDAAPAGEDAVEPAIEGGEPVDPNE